MLSGETSVGQYPIKSGADDGADHRGRRGGADVACRRSTTSRAPSAACCPSPPATSASGSRRAALVAFTLSGDTVRRLARLHTRLPLLAFTPKPEVRNQLALTWGVRDVPRRLRDLDRRHGPPGRPRDAVDRPVQGGRHRGRSSPARRPALRVDEPDPRAPPGRGRPRLTRLTFGRRCGPALRGWRGDVSPDRRHADAEGAETRS